MRHALASEHFIYYNEHSHLEVEGLLTDSKADLLYESTRSFCKRGLSAEESYAQGRDVWRKDPAIKQGELSPLFTSMACQLFRASRLRLVYDQLFSHVTRGGILFETPTNLKQISCFQGIVGGLMLRLTDGEEISSSETAFCPAATLKGSGVFFSYKLPLDVQSLLERPSQAFLLIAYGPVNTVYIQNPKDPNSHLLKHEGYPYGERLHDDRHPILKT